jgi:hypothetical protein
MVHALKNITIRLWISIVSGGLVTLGLLAILGSPLDATFNLIVFTVMIILAFFGCGWIFNRITALRLQDYLLEATAKERTVRIGEAAEAFRKAINLFDSFMASPLFRSRMGRDLAARVARFHIARSQRYPEAERFITSYLWTNPDDVEVSEYWLQHTNLGEKAEPDHLALADRIASAQPRNLTVQVLITETYLSRNRTDYAALQTYKRFLKESTDTPAATVIKLADLFLKEGRADEWALEVFLKANGQKPDHADYLKGLASCLDQVRKTRRNASLLEAAREALDSVDEETIQQWRDEYRRTTQASLPTEPSLTIRIMKLISKLIRKGFRGLVAAAKWVTPILSKWGRDLGTSWKESERMRHIVKWSAVIVFAAVVIISGISTIIHISETREPPESVSIPAETPPPAAASGRYTIQIASYRNRNLAIERTDRMKELGYPDTYWGESRISDDNIWYYVRVSRFEEKQKAKEFGDNLKSDGIIDDFYVANYKQP